MLHAADVDSGRPLWIVLGAVHIRPRRGVQDEVGGETGRRREGNVPVRTGQAACAGKRLEQRVPELAPRAGYDDAAVWSRCERIGDRVLQSSTTRGSFHGTPCSSGSSGSYSSVTK
jgi:hypothetical protein